MQYLKACIVDFYFNIKDIEISYNKKWIVGYEVNNVGSKDLKFLDIWFQTFNLRF